MDFFNNFDSNYDEEFISTFFNVMQHIQESSNVARSRAAINIDRQAARSNVISV